ncbi:MAG: hypothetical protein ABSG53_16075, partial [Thermoguttaceae bacterium]
TAALKFDRPKKAVPGTRREGLDPTGELSVEGIVAVALERQELRPDEVCLFARIVDEVPGLTVTPEARQTRQAALLVAHLDAGRLPEPERDVRRKDSSP